MSKNPESPVDQMVVTREAIIEALIDGAVDWKSSTTGQREDHQADRIAVLIGAEVSRLESLHRSEIADMAERFRAVNVSEAVKQLADILPAAPAEQMVAWQLVNESTPKGQLLLYFPASDKNGRNHQVEMIKVDLHPVHYPRKPTHWMPLPAAPAKLEDQP